jgi:3D (Asp-Asp-Asp) domain-containing protein
MRRHLLKRPIVKSSRGVFLSPMAALTVVVLAAIICVGTPQIKAGLDRPLPDGTAASSTANSTQTAEQSDEWQTVRMRVTAYCPCRKCCGRFSDGVTASGHKIQPRDTFVAADKKYRFGTEMIVPGYNNAEPVKVLDRGCRIYGNRLDVFFHSHGKAKEWGVRYFDVRVRRATLQ